MRDGRLVGGFLWLLLALAVLGALRAAAEGRAGRAFWCLVAVGVLNWSIRRRG